MEIELRLWKHSSRRRKAMQDGTRPLVRFRFHHSIKPLLWIRLCRIKFTTESSEDSQIFPHLNIITTVIPSFFNSSLRLRKGEKNIWFTYCNKHNHKHRCRVPCLKPKCSRLCLYHLVSHGTLKSSTQPCPLYSRIKKVWHMSGQTFHETASGAFNSSTFPPFHLWSAASQR